MMDTKLIEQQSLEVVSQAQEIKIATHEQNEFAGEFLKTIKGVQKQVKETFEPIIKKTRDALKEVRDQQDKHLKPLSDAESLIKGKMLGFQREENAKRAYEEAKLAEEARIREAKEKAKLEKKAIKAEEKGDTEKAEILREQKEEVHVPAPVIPDAPKQEGISTKKLWKARVIKEALVPREYLVVDLVKLNKMARAVHDTITIPGVEIYFEETMSART